MSIPLVEDTSITVYYCADRYTFYFYHPYCQRLVIRAGIKPAEASDSEWEYFNVLDVICNGSINCRYPGYDNFNNCLIVTLLHNQVNVALSSGLLVGGDEVEEELETIKV